VLPVLAGARLILPLTSPPAARHHRTVVSNQPRHLALGEEPAPLAPSLGHSAHSTHPVPLCTNASTSAPTDEPTTAQDKGRHKPNLARPTLTGGPAAGWPYPTYAEDPSLLPPPPSVGARACVGASHRGDNAWRRAHRRVWERAWWRRCRAGDGAKTRRTVLLRKPVLSWTARPSGVCEGDKSRNWEFEAAAIRKMVV